MSKFGQIMKYISSELSQHSPAILTGLGIAGMIGTVVLAVKATPKAMERIEEKEAETPVEKVKAAWKCYIPTVVTGGVSIACVIGAQKINSKRLAALATAYSMTETAFKEYKDKVVEKLGEKKEKEVRDEVNEDRLRKELEKDPDPFPYRLMANGDVPCYDATLGFEFLGTWAKVEGVVSTLNNKMTYNRGADYVSLNEYRLALGVDRCDFGEELGWNPSTIGLIDLDMSYRTINGLTWLIISHNRPPRYGYDIYSDDYKYS